MVGPDSPGDRTQGERAPRSEPAQALAESLDGSSVVL